MTWSAGRNALAVSFAVLILCLTIDMRNVDAATPALLELKVGKTPYRGKLIAKNKYFCWLMDRDGKLNSINLKSVASFRQVSPRFRGFTAGDMRTKLIDEFGKEFEVSGTQHYLVCAGKGKAKQYAAIFEDIYRTFYMYFRTRRFDIREPEFPMVAIVFPSQKLFAQYCAKDDVRATKTLRGYYLRTSNRVALFATGTESLTLNNSQNNGGANLYCPPGVAKRREFAARTGHLKMAVPYQSSSFVFACDCGGSKYPRSPFSGSSRRSQRGPALLNQPNVRQMPLTFEKINGSLKDTIIHEATHQVAFNTGLHVRIGSNPKWVVEGLATVFEAPGIRDSSKSRGGNAKQRINRERYLWFQNFKQERRKPYSLETFIADDKMFESAALDAYSQAWALTFYLIETRPRKYAELLKIIASKDPMYEYKSRDRVKDFQKVFGSNMKLLDADFVRFMDRLK